MVALSSAVPDNLSTPFEIVILDIQRRSDGTRLAISSISRTVNWEPDFNLLIMSSLVSSRPWSFFRFSISLITFWYLFFSLLSSPIEAFRSPTLNPRTRATRPKTTRTDSRVIPKLMTLLRACSFFLICLTGSRLMRIIFFSQF